MSLTISNLDSCSKTCWITNGSPPSVREIDKVEGGISRYTSITTHRISARAVHSLKSLVSKSLWSPEVLSRKQESPRCFLRKISRCCCYQRMVLQQALFTGTMDEYVFRRTSTMIQSLKFKWSFGRHGHIKIPTEDQYPNLRLDLRGRKGYRMMQ